MNNFKIIPFSKEYVNRIKAAQCDDFGNEVIEMVATGFGPCRLSLKPFEVGIDRRLLFKHSPFDIDNVFNQPGPVFIQKEDVEPYNDLNNFPPEIKADKTNFPLTLIGYNHQQMMVFTQLVGNDDVDNLINTVFETQPQIAYLHARNAEAGCFICKIERI